MVVQTGTNACQEEEKLCQCKVAIVTGGGSEAGYYIADQFLNAGAQV